MPRRFLALFVGQLLWMSACTSEPTAPHAEAPAVRRQPFSNTVFHGDPVHEEIVEGALDFLQPAVLAYLQEVAGYGTDFTYFNDSSYHFDDCAFANSSLRIAEEQGRAVQHLDPAVQGTDSPGLAQRAFGRSLHVAQDFYAHSNWVELGQTTLFNRSAESLAARSDRRPFG